MRSTDVAAGWVRRAQVLLLLAAGLSVRAVQAQSPRRQRHWKQRFEQQGLDGLLDAGRPGRPMKLGAEMTNVENESFKRFVGDMVYALTSQ